MHKFLLVLLVLFCALCYPVIAADAPPAKNTPDLPKTKINPKDSAEMALIPAGEFLMGTSEEELTTWLKSHPNDKREDFADEMPQHKVYLDAFYMYKTDGDGGAVSEILRSDETRNADRAYREVAGKSSHRVCQLG